MAQENTDMTTQLTRQPIAQTVKTVGTWCALSLSAEGLSASYLGRKPMVHQASEFIARNPRNFEADTRAALD